MASISEAQFFLSAQHELNDGSSEMVEIKFRLYGIDASNAIEFDQKSVTDSLDTHPANHGFPPATFDYLFARRANAGEPMITKTPVSDHFPVT